MATEASAVHFARADSLAHLQHLIDESLDPGLLSGASFPSARLALSPLFEDGFEPVSSSALELELRARWAGSRALDRAAGRTLTGPHRVDFEVTHAQKAMPAALGSTGEQKALLIGLILAHARLVARMTGIAPFLLLDEVAAHLDPDRRASLFTALDALGTQCLLTGTDKVLFDALGGRAQTVVVSGGRLQKAP
jgi:DNA replication and repair protein RecF